MATQELMQSCNTVPTSIMTTAALCHDGGKDGDPARHMTVRTEEALQLLEHEEKFSQCNSFEGDFGA